MGLGPAADEANPLATLALPAFERMAGGARWTSGAPALVRPRHVFRPLDATLGLPGLPQSGTGQAALFTGRNGAALAGRHFGPFPPSATWPAIQTDNVFARLLRAGVPTERLAFANAYPNRFFRYVERSGRWTTTTRCCRAAGVRLRTGADLARGDALPADLTGEGWPEAPAPPPISEEEAGRRLARIARAHTFTLFEFFLTDKAGHSRDAERAASVLRSLDRFFAALLDGLAHDVLLVVTSDHGNLEDLTTKGHTRNAVPLIALGPGAGAFADAASLTDVAPALVEAVGAGG